MADNGKAVINLTTGHEDADKVTSRSSSPPQR
jgi:hypothetical protein